MRVAFASLLAASAAVAAQAQPATFVTAHATGMAVLPEAPQTTVGPSGVPPAIAAPVPDARQAPMPGTARARYLPLIVREVAGTGLPVAIADTVAWIESGYDPSVVGGVGEIGLMQVRPATAAMLGFRGTDAELAAPEVNVAYGVRYLAEAWRLAGGDLCRALMKYRAGHGSETMSPLSQTYCARARAILGGTVAAEVPAGVRSTGSPHRKTAAPLSFWQAQEARVMKIRARVVATWRARGWRPG